MVAEVNMAKTITLAKDEQILAVVPQHVSGPGWDNRITWVYIQDNVTGRVRSEDIQPHEQTVELATLWESGAAMVDALYRSVYVQRMNMPDADLRRQCDP